MMLMLMMLIMMMLMLMMLILMMLFLILMLMLSERRPARSDLVVLVAHNDDPTGSLTASRNVFILLF